MQTVPKLASLAQPLAGPRSPRVAQPGSMCLGRLVAKAKPPRGTKTIFLSLHFSPRAGWAPPGWGVGRRGAEDTAAAPSLSIRFRHAGRDAAAAAAARGRHGGAAVHAHRLEPKVRATVLRRLPVGLHDADARLPAAARQVPVLRPEPLAGRPRRGPHCPNPGRGQAPPPHSAQAHPLLPPRCGPHAGADPAGGWGRGRRGAGLRATSAT